MTSMKSILYFDTEDSISPPENGADDIVLFLAEALSQRELRGSFHIIGDKARTLVSRNRQDVIASVARHDVSSHYNHGSVHPTTTARIAQCDWHQGVKLALEEEKPGFATIEQIFGRCAGLTRHGGSYSPQAIHAAGQCGKVFYGVPFEMDHHRAFWFAGTLCFSILGLVIDPVTHQGGAGYLESVYHDSEAFEKQMAKFDEALKTTCSQHAFTSLFGSHPHRLNTTEYSCWNYYHGKTRTPPLPPPLRTAELRETGKRNILRLFDYLATQRHRVQITGLSELAQHFGSQPRMISADILLPYSLLARQSGDVPLHDHYSPAELLVGLAESLLKWSADGRLPQSVQRSNVIGPATLSDDVSWKEPVSLSDALAAAEKITQHARQYGMLPTQPACHWALSALANAYADAASGKRDGSWRFPERAPWPQVAEGWREPVDAMRHWSVFPRDLDFQKIVMHTCLQSWSVKPAWGASSKDDEVA